MTTRGPWPLEFRVLALQLGSVVLAALAGLLLAGPGSERDAAVSVLAGGGCALLPNAWLALRACRAAAPGSELASAAGMFLATLGKLAFTVALLALALARLEALVPLAFFGGFIVAVVAHHGAFLFEDAPGDT